MGDLRGFGRRRGTVRTRTTVAATLILALTLLLGGAAMLTLLRRSLVRNLDDVADIRADDIAAMTLQGPLPDRLALEDDAVGQVVDDHGRVLAASPNVGSDAPVSRLRPTGSEPVLRTVDSIPGLSGSYRLLALRATSPQGPVTIYIGTSLEPVADTLALVRTSLLVGAPLLLVLVATMTWMTVGRALRPVEGIRAQVADLSSRHLDRRVPVPDTDDEIGRLAVTMNGMLDRLEAAARRQQRFVADASHELQTPLAAVRADLEVALTHPDETPWVEVALDLLDENRHMEQLVADLLFIARVDHAVDPRPASPVDLHEVVLDEATRLAAARRVRVDTTGVRSAVVPGRRDDLARAVRNLLDNAERHARSTVTVALTNGTSTESDDAGTSAGVVVTPGESDDGRASVSTRTEADVDSRAGAGARAAAVARVGVAPGDGRAAVALANGAGRRSGTGAPGVASSDGTGTDVTGDPGDGAGRRAGGGTGSVELVVEDDGPGVPPGDRARIFERFTRLDDGRSRSAGGTGLGLAIVKEIVERHGGQVAVGESPHGARFVVTLPSDD